MFSGAATAADFCIAGTVVDAQTGEPLGRAAITIPQTAAQTDVAGTFRFCGLAAGSYFASGEKQGFVTAGIEVTVGPSREGVLLRLQPLAAIQGKVTDTDGKAMEHAAMQLLSFSVENGRRQTRLTAAAATDGRGEYRFPGLKPGRYLVRAGGRTANTDARSIAAFAPVYYGGATDAASATLVETQPGRNGIADFSVERTAGHTIHGTVSGFSAQAAIKIELLSPEGDLNAAPVKFNAETGSFEMISVAAGSYIVRASQGEGEERLRGEQTVEVSEDVYDVALPLAAATALKGIVRTAGAEEPAAASPPACSVELSSAAVSMAGDAALESSTDDAGEFEFEGVLPGRYRVRMDCANGYIATARMGGADLLAHDEFTIAPGGTPLIEAVLKTDGATIEVTPATESESNHSAGWLALLPEAANDLRIRFAILDGKITLSGIAPGDYKAYAWSGSPYAFEYENPAARQAWAARAVSVHVAERDHQSISVKVLPGDAPLQ